MTGTGDGGPVGGSRKIKSFLWMSLVIMLFVAMVTLIHTPDMIAINALYMIGGGGLFAIGGQAAVDAVSKWRAGASESTTVTKEVKVTEAPPRKATK